MNETPPDRLAVDPGSPFHDAEALARGVGVRFKGVEKTNVEEYCVSEGWVRLAVGSTVNRQGKPMTVRLQGEVEPYFRDAPELGDPESSADAESRDPEG
ncbi:MAG: hypothetical protein JWO83_2339 [Caulobacteraceae bacterium]|nr:hypothetical protein [Caulobacteraceae bacterium]